MAKKSTPILDMIKKELLDVSKLLKHTLKSIPALKNYVTNNLKDIKYVPEDLMLQIGKDCNFAIHMELITQKKKNSPAVYEFVAEVFVSTYSYHSGYDGDMVEMCRGRNKYRLVENFCMALLKEHLNSVFEFYSDAENREEDAKLEAMMLDEVNSVNA